jgi:glutamyl-Q tRNA(Asp) synthetase
VLRQSEHLDDYRAAAEKLDRIGLLYPCFMNRAELAAAFSQHPGSVDPDGSPLVSRATHCLAAAETARRRASGLPFALRIDMDRAAAVLRGLTGGRVLSFTEIDADGGGSRDIPAAPARWGDAVIVRKDISASYHLAVVVDDARQGVTHVTRGLDLFAATDLHRLIQVLLGLPEPVYHHHRLITDEGGRKLSKSARDASLRALRASGVTPADVRRLIGLT